MRRNAIAVVLCFALVLVSSLLFADTFVLTGNYLKVGVSNSGGLVDDNLLCGIQYDPLGGGSFGVFDYFLPGEPFEFWSVGVNDPLAGEVVKVVTNNGDWGDPFGMTTTDTSSGSTLSAHTTGSWIDAGLGLDVGIVQGLSFDVNGDVISFHTALTNNGQSAFDGAFARGGDPDQDVNLYGGLPYNTVQTINSIPAANDVRAVGPFSGFSIDLTDDQGGGVPSIDVEWNTNPFYLFYSPPNDGFGDNSINIAWGGTINAGQTVDLYYSYRLGREEPIPEPGTLSLLGLSLCSLLGLRRRRK